MHYSTLAALLPLAAAQTIRIDVGLNGLMFTPDIVTAAPGAELEFHYHPKAHSVSQASFAKPCVPLADGFNSGFVPVASGESPKVFTVTVNDTKPIWIYCAQAMHCQSGMTMVVNQPTDPTKSLAVFQQNAKSVPMSAMLPVVEGGVFSDSNSTSSAPPPPPGGNGTSIPPPSNGNYTAPGSPGSSVTAGAPGAGVTPAPGQVYTSAGHVYTAAGSVYTSAGQVYTATPTQAGSSVHTGAAVAGQMLDWTVLGGAALAGALFI